MAKLKGKAKANARKKAQKKWNFPKNPHSGSASGMLKGTPFKHTATPGGGIMFNVATEMSKMLATVTDEVTPYNTRSNLTDFNSIDWGYDGGFLIAIVPAQPNDPRGRGLYAKTNDANNLKSVLADFQRIRLDDNWDMLSTFCTPDRAWDHYNDIVDGFHYAVVGYSTIKNIAPLAENRALCLALKNGTDPRDTLKKSYKIGEVA